MMVFVFNLHVLLEVDGVASHDRAHLWFALDVNHLVLRQTEAPGDSFMKNSLNQPENRISDKEAKPRFSLLSALPHLKQIIK